MSLTSMYIRYSFGKGDRKRDAGLSTPEDVKRYDDILYGRNRKWQVLDVYRPKGAEGKLPVIVSVHGGGWVYGNKEVYQFYCMSLAQRGFAVVNFTYRLAPEYRYPAQLEDTDAVIHWIFDHKEDYGFDVNNIFAVGDSAGGHLLSVYTAMLNDRSYADYYGLDIHTRRINPLRAKRRKRGNLRVAPGDNIKLCFFVGFKSLAAFGEGIRAYKS